MVKVDAEKVYTVEEYFAMEEQSEMRHEYYYGNLYDMPGTSILHNELCQMIWMLLRQQIAYEKFSIATESVKVQISNEEIFLYPDIVVGQKASNPGSTYLLKNPILIAEVLSDSTRRYDSTDKFIQYRKIDSLQYYLLVEPEKKVVIFYEKANDGDWVGKTFTEDAEEVKLPQLNASLKLGEIYNR
jgi:Uma2 family endonuclease